VTNSETDIEELQKLQREASARRAQRHEERSAAREAEAHQTADEAADSAAENPPAAAPESDQSGVEAELPAPALSQQFETFLEELEEAAKERPTLALLAAFSVGVIVGQLFSRK
jgi:hypothetical protein